MCLLCIEIAKGTMTPKELARAYLEFEIPESEGEYHWADVLEKIYEQGQDTFEETSNQISEIITKRYQD